LTSYISAATGWFKATLHFGAIRKQPDNAAELQQHRQKTALLFEHFGDSDRAFTTRMSIAKTPYSVENAFAIARLLEKKLPYATFKTFLTNHFKERSSDFMLASARRDAFAKQDKENAAERAAFLERIRFSAEREPEHIGLQLALGFAELASGNADGALCQFTMAWVLNEQRRRAAIDRGQPAPEGEQVDPWSLAYAFACASEGPQARSYGIFRPIDSMRLNLAGAKMLRAEGAGLAALSFYGTLVNTSFAGRPPLKHIAYRNFWITYYQDRWVAVPRSFVLSWILPVTLGSGMPATVRKASKWKQIRGIKLWIGTVRKASKWKQIRGIKLWIGNRIASLIRFGRRLPGSKVALRLFARFRNFVFQRFGSRFGVLFASELSTLKQKIDVLSR
jgi:hypothetical protein